MHIMKKLSGCTLTNVTSFNGLMSLQIKFTDCMTHEKNNKRSFVYVSLNSKYREERFAIISSIARKQLWLI